jgi:hypothetical protein
VTGGSVGTGGNAGTGTLSATGGSAAVGGANDCSSNPLRCCDRSVGVFVESFCDATTGAWSCRAAAVEVAQGRVCAPTGFELGTCDELNDKTCPSVDFECHEAGKCTTFCTCEIHPPGDLPVWTCKSLAC